MSTTSESSDSSNQTPSVPSRPDLSDREQNILQLVVEHFIDTAGPVGSRSLAKAYNIGLSPASIRNTMSDLEDMGYLDHPYTSAGRVPTELGYRTFVDVLMDEPELSEEERTAVKLQLARLVSDTDELLRESTLLLSKLTNLLGLGLTPSLSTGVLERLEIVPLSGSRLMFVLSVRGGLVKTLVIGFEADVRRSEVDRVVSILNERLAGLTLREIRDTHEERVRDVQDETGIVELMREESALLFSEPKEGRLTLRGTQNILTQPEFQQLDDVKHLIQVIEDEDRVVGLLDESFSQDPGAVGRTYIRIGSENEQRGMDAYSIVVSPYRLGETVGTLGVIGPTRMDYRRAVALVGSMASVLTHSDLDDARPPGSTAVA